MRDPIRAAKAHVRRGSAAASLRPACEVISEIYGLLTGAGKTGKPIAITSWRNRRGATRSGGADAGRYSGAADAADCAGVLEDISLGTAATAVAGDFRSYLAETVTP
jgi:hypothetical protein